jgi:prepilin-type N-terminal cleavage/methylation domain-containing protein
MKKQLKGFTIIEVVLVLAIAGLIFLMVFLALPALQRNQRNTARRNDVGIVSAAIQTYMSNNRGAVPPAAQCTVNETTGVWSGGSFCDYIREVSMNVVHVRVFNGLSAAANINADNILSDANRIRVYTGATCGVGSQAGQVVPTSARNQSAVIMRMEAGGNATIPYCVDV